MNRRSGSSAEKKVDASKKNSDSSKKKADASKRKADASKRTSQSFTELRGHDSMLKKTLTRYWLNYSHILISKDTSGFTSNTLLTMIQKGIVMCRFLTTV